jgi:ubiquinone/menaquinone biosynthesis C-methylase UbiE
MGPRTGTVGPKDPIRTWHDWRVTDQEARYDRIADGYARWWSPIHRPATLALLDALEPELAAGAVRVLDVGCGTGALAAAAVDRWPDVRITGVDVSAGMLAVAERELASLPGAARDRVTLVQAPAEPLPFPDGSFDLVLSTFVLQLVPSRFRALREARRVLGAGGTMAYATWLAGGSLPADEAYAEALVAAGLEPRDDGGDGDDPRSPAQAAARLRRAGFRGVTTRTADVDHRFTPESFLAFLENFDDEDLFATLEPTARAALVTDLLTRLRALADDGLRMRLPVVIAKGRRTTRA